MLSRAILTFVFVFLAIAPASASYREGRDAYNRGDWAQAILYLRPLAEYGDDRAMVILGNMYNEGYGVAKDPKEAFALYRAAALKNNFDGMLAVATFYQQGLGVPKNIRLAVDWFHRAGRLGSAPGAFFYAIHLYQGFRGSLSDVQPNHTEAYKWFRITEKLTQNDPQMKNTAVQAAQKIAEKLKKEEVTAMDLEAAAFKPVDPANAGPPPEQVLLDEVEKKETEMLNRDGEKRAVPPELVKP